MRVQLQGNNNVEQSKLYGANGQELTPQGDGFFFLRPNDVNALSILPPLHWSSPIQGDVTFVTFTDVTDIVGQYTSNTTTPYNITMYITGVADPPSTKSIVVASQEDEDYQIGREIGELYSVLVDVSTLP